MSFLPNSLALSSGTVHRRVQKVFVWCIKFASKNTAYLVYEENLLIINVHLLITISYFYPKMPVSIIFKLIFVS